MSGVGSELTQEEVIKEMRGGLLYVAVTLAEGGTTPYVSTLSWVSPADNGTVHLALDVRSTTLANVRRHGTMQLIFLGAGGCHVLSGHAVVAEERVAGVSIPAARVILDVKEIRNAMHFGHQLTTLPGTSPVYDPAAAGRLDAQVMSALAAGGRVGA